MQLVQIIVRSASAEAVKTVEKAFHQAGLETSLHVFANDPDSNAMVAIEIAEEQAAGAHPIQAWVVPSAFVGLQEAGAKTAATTRAMAGLPRRQAHDGHLLILLDGEVTAEAGDMVVPLTALEDKYFCPAKLKAIFG